MPGLLTSDGAIFSFSRVPQLPVCARHTVQDAKLARRRLRLTPEVNSGCLCPSAQAPDVARGPRALKDGLPADTPPFAHSSGHNLSVHPVLPGGAAARQKQGGLGGNYF